MFSRIFGSGRKKNSEIAKVKSSMSYLLNFQHDHVVELFFKNFPSFEVTIIHAAAEGKEPLVTAVELLAIAFAHTIDNGQMSELERMAMEEFSVKGVGSGSNLGRALQIFLRNCAVQRDMNKIDESLYLIALTEPIGALRGLSHEERSRRRVLAAVDDLLNLDRNRS